MPLDLERLENVRDVSGKIIARCPACAETGADRTGEHLYINSDGRYGCIQFPGLHGIKHRQRIFELAGLPDESAPIPKHERGREAASSAPARSSSRAAARGWATLDEGIVFMEGKLGMAASRRDIYQTADGSDFVIVVRLDGGGRKQYRPFHHNGAGWVARDPEGLLPLFRLPEMLARPEERVYVTEGEKAADALGTLGLLATTSAHGAKSAHKTDWSPLAGRDVVILPDNDAEGRAYAATVAGILEKLSPPATVRVLDLPGLPPAGDVVEWMDGRDGQTDEDIRAELDKLVEESNDLPARTENRERAAAPQPCDDSASSRTGVNQAAIRIANAIRDIVAKGDDRSRGPSLEKCFDELREIVAPSSYPPIVAANDFLLIEPVMPLEIVQGMIHQGSKVVIGGASKTNKTWSLLDLAISVATGTPWWGRETKQGNVLFVNLEVQPEFFWQRVKRLVGAKGVPVPSNLDIWNLRGTSADLAKMLPLLVRAAERKKYALIIIDPIYKCLAGWVENAAEDVAAMMNEAERIAVATGAAVAFVAHFSKGNQAWKEPIDRISGSGVFARDPDTILTLTKHDHEGAFTVEVTLRNFAPTEPFVMKWEWPLMLMAEGLDPAKLKKPKGGRDAIYSINDILEVIGLETMTSGELKKAVKEEHGMSEAKFYGLLREAKAQDKIKKTASGKWSKI